MNKQNGFRCMLMFVVLCTALAGAETPKSKAFDVEYGQKLIDGFARQEAVCKKRVDALTEELLEMDKAIENKVDGLVAAVAAVKDSTDSGTRIEHNKRELIEGLQKSIRFYQQRRAAKKAQFLSPGNGVSKEDLKKDMDFLDTRMDERIDQIVSIAQSFTRHENHKKYIYEYKDTAYKDWYYRDRDINPEYKQNKRATQTADKSREDLIEDAQAAMAKLQRENAVMQGQIRGASSQADYDRKVAEMERNQHLIEKLADNIDALAGVGKGLKTTPVKDAKEAHELELNVRKTVSEIHADYRVMLAKKSRLDLERSRLNGVRSKLHYNQKVMEQITGSSTE